MYFDQGMNWTPYTCLLSERVKKVRQIFPNLAQNLVFLAVSILYRINTSIASAFFEKFSKNKHKKRKPQNLVVYFFKNGIFAVCFMKFFGVTLPFEEIVRVFQPVFFILLYYRQKWWHLPCPWRTALHGAVRKGYHTTHHLPGALSHPQNEWRCFSWK